MREAGAEVAAWLYGLTMQRYEDARIDARCCLLPDLRMLNLENLGMRQVAIRDRPLAAIAAPASDGPVVMSPTECVQHRAGELNE
jgi:hypothetical protein